MRPEIFHRKCRRMRNAFQGANGIWSTNGYWHFVFFFLTEFMANESQQMLHLVRWKWNRVIDTVWVKWGIAIRRNWDYASNVHVGREKCGIFDAPETLIISLTIGLCLGISTFSGIFRMTKHAIAIVGLRRMLLRNFRSIDMGKAFQRKFHIDKIESRTMKIDSQPMWCVPIPNDDCAHLWIYSRKNRIFIPLSHTLASTKRHRLDGKVHWTAFNSFSDSGVSQRTNTHAELNEKYAFRHSIFYSIYLDTQCAIIIKELIESEERKVLPCGSYTRGWLAQIALIK